MRLLQMIIILLVICACPALSQQASFPRFDDYGVTVYKGKLQLSEWIEFLGGDEWRDKLGKLVEAPNVNFAGKYFLAAHSCGTGCRYYSLTDLSSGNESDAADMFASSEEGPKTADGNKYTTILLSVGSSRL